MTVKKKKTGIKRRPKMGKPLTASQSKYKHNPSYAAKLRKRSQQQYRSQRGSNFELEGATTLRSLTMLEDFTKTLVVTNLMTGEATKHEVILQTVLAELVNKPYQTIWRWIEQNGQLPKPNLIDNSEGREKGVYHIEEVRVIVATLGEHFKHFRYYRHDHHNVRDHLFNQIEALRKSNYGEKPNGKNTNTSRKSTSKKTSRRTRSRRG